MQFVDNIVLRYGQWDIEIKPDTPQLLLCVDKEENVIPETQAKQLGFQGDGALPSSKAMKEPSC